MKEVPKSGIYIRHNGEQFYVGHSKDVIKRGAHYTGRLLVRQKIDTNVE